MGWSLHCKNALKLKYALCGCAWQAEHDNDNDNDNDDDNDNEDMAQVKEAVIKQHIQHAAWPDFACVKRTLCSTAMLCV